MPCVVLALLFFGPRVALALLWFFSDYVGSAYSSVLWPLAGFFFAPFFTLAYAFAVHQYGGFEGLGAVACVVAALLDLGVIGSTAKKKD